MPSSTGGSLTAFTTQRAAPLAPRTGSYVYSSPAVSEGRVFFGSYNGVFYALSARDGATLWARRTGGPISGAAVVVDGVAYAGSFAHRILGVDVRHRPRRARLPARRVRAGLGRRPQAAAARLFAPLRGGGALKRSCSRSPSLVLAAAGAGVAYYLHVKHESRDVHGSSTVEFVTTARRRPPPPKEPGVAWPTYGQNAERQRFANGVLLAPPFTRGWTFRAQALVEFPPAIAYGRLFFANNAGVLFAIGAQNGKRAWKYVSHRCVAASPAVDRHVVFETFMNAPPCNRKPSAR